MSDKFDRDSLTDWLKDVLLEQYIPAHSVDYLLYTYDAYTPFITIPGLKTVSGNEEHYRVSDAFRDEMIQRDFVSLDWAYSQIEGLEQDLAAAFTYNHEAKACLRAYLVSMGLPSDPKPAALPKPLRALWEALS